MKLSGNLERIADKAVNIARKACELNGAPLLPEVHFLEPIYREVISMLSDVLRAYTESNLDLAISIPPRDKKLDAMIHEITETIIVQMTKFPERIQEYLGIILIARHLERAGDHVKNIAEDVVFAKPPRTSATWASSVPAPSGYHGRERRRALAARLAALSNNLPISSAEAVNNLGKVGYALASSRIARNSSVLAWLCIVGDSAHSFDQRSTTGCKSRLRAASFSGVAVSNHPPWRSLPKNAHRQFM